MKKNTLSLLLAVFIMCGMSIAERGHSAMAQRGLAVGPRPTNAPTTSPTHKPTHEEMPATGDDDNETGKGKGRPHPNGDDDDDSGKGKGRPTPEGDDDDSGKGEMIPDDDAFSYPIGKGKGARPPKSKKSAKSSKSGKAGKSDKTAGKPSKPSMPTPSEPSSPVAPTPTTPSPTSENSIAVRAAPFALTYAPSSNVPSTVDYAQLAEVTRLYMEEFMVTEFEATSLTNLDDFLTFMTRNEFESGQPALAEYTSTGLFNPSSIFLPTVRELNQLISEAFNSNNLPEYLKRVQSLPRSNPFSDTDEIVFSEVSSSTTSSTDTTGSFMRAGVAAAAAGVVVLAAGLAIMRSRVQGDVEEDQTFSPAKKMSGDATIAGETCNMSVDTSSVAHSWKTPMGFQNNTQEDESEFEDEPLNSDDEDSSMTSRQATMRMTS
ncbi:hypothetical protein IV203_015155 [Nitzschia inconspicua]|uniref:Transmembrane protein n=1 Tax=Nitzschia inconspicua TaxID=303405 RepID=A0A9K3LC64_9STRA|nr:hypothetical protein IV203_015155 [Nitzschia inconspicua]